MAGKSDYLELKILDVLFGYQHAIQSSTAATPVVITTTVNHSVQVGDRVSVFGHTTQIGANGEWSPGSVTSNTITLTGSTLSGGAGGATGTVKKMLDVGITNFFGLWTTTLTDASTGSTGTETTGGSYARASVTNNFSTWSNAVTGSKTNTGTITFPTASANWSGITDWAVLDASSTGNILYFGAFGATQTVSNGQTASWAASGITITED